VSGPYDLTGPAKAIARKERLLSEDGVLSCWECGVECDWHVSLHCPDCLQAARAKIQAAKDWGESTRERLERETLARLKDRTMNEADCRSLIARCTDQWDWFRDSSFAAQCSEIVNRRFERAGQQSGGYRRFNKGDRR
jgi:hypothetical protein